jgi:hypothetical protein
VRVELARRLGEAGGDICRDCVLRRIQDDDAHVRRACIDQLHFFAKDRMVADAIRNVLNNGDPNYDVEVGALLAYAGREQKDAAAVIQPWLSKPSQ